MVVLKRTMGFVRSLKKILDAARLPSTATFNDEAGLEARRAAPLRSARSAFISAAVFSGAMNVLMLSGSLFMLQVYDRVLPSRSLATLQALLVLIVILYGFFAILEAIRNRIFSRIGARLDALLGAAVFDSNLKRGLPGAAMAASPFRDLEQVRGFLAGGGPAAFFDLPWAPLYVGLLFLLHPWFGVFGLVGVAILSALAWRTERITGPLQAAASRSTSEAAAWAENARRGAEAILPMGMGKAVREQWLSKNQGATSATIMVSDAAAGLGGISKFVRMTLQSAVLALGAYLVIVGQASGGVMIASSILLGRALAPVELAIGHWRGFVAARQSYARLREALKPAAKARLSLPAPCKRIEVEKLVVLGSADGKPRLRDVTFSLEAGDALGVIGPSGSGKSTLVRALIGVVETTRGSVRFDGSTLDQWDPAASASFIGYLPQDVELFPGTVGENIARFAPDADPAAILAAANAAGVERFIRGLPHGFDTRLGERGAGVSVGERQRIALARALFGAPFLVVLDEPNSALDAEGEGALARAIESIRKRGGIAVVVAHRPSAIRATNKVLVLSAGQQVQFGPREEIVAKLAPSAKSDAQATKLERLG